MKICIAQIRPSKGDVITNINKHLTFIECAIQRKADLIFFPELSITSYEPTLAGKLAKKPQDPAYDVFQSISNRGKIMIGVGAPIQTVEGIHIGMMIFEPEKERSFYLKQTLHADEVPFFQPGEQSRYWDCGGRKLAFGICYEALQRQHFLDAMNEGAKIYIASVAKPQEGIDKALAYFPKMAMTFDTPILIVNCIGHCDDFESIGHSSIWNKKGQLIGQLDEKQEGILIYDSVSDTLEDKMYFK